MDYIYIFGKKNLKQKNPMIVVIRCIDFFYPPLPPSLPPPLFSFLVVDHLKSCGDTNADSKYLQSHEHRECLI